MIENGSDDDVAAPHRRRPSARRWWLLATWLLLAAGGFIALWTLPMESRQARVLLSILVGAATVAGLWLWLLLASGIPWRRRLLACGVILVLGGAVATQVEVVGVSGDLVPELSFRRGDREQGSSPPPDPAPDAPAPGANVVAGSLPHAPYPQFLGPSRTAVVNDVELETDWSAAPPRLLWRRPVGAGWSSFAVVEGRAVTQEQNGDLEAVVCYSLDTGLEIWRHEYPARYYELIAGAGPRATPTIAGGRVLTLGATGILKAIDLATGEERWTRTVTADASSKAKQWGMSGSPLVLDDRVVVNAGGRDGFSLIAYELDDGTIAFHGGDSRGGYASPVVTNLAGRRQIILFNSRDVTGHDAASGAVLWSHRWNTQHPTASQPLVVGTDRVLISSGYGAGCELLQLKPQGETFAVQSLWKTRRLKAKFSNTILHEGFAYGLDDGVLVCLDLADGERRWKRGRYGHGQLLQIGRHLLVVTEDGELVLLDPSPGGPAELSRLQAIHGKTWNHPAFAFAVPSRAQRRGGSLLRATASIHGSRAGNTIAGSRWRTFSVLSSPPRPSR